MVPQKTPPKNKNRPPQKNPNQRTNAPRAVSEELIDIDVGKQLCVLEAAVGWCGGRGRRGGIKKHDDDL